MTIFITLTLGVGGLVLLLIALGLIEHRHRDEVASVRVRDEQNTLK